MLKPGPYPDEELSHRRPDYLTLGALDVHIFQQLPLFLRRRELKERRVLYVRDEDTLYELAFRTARAFENYTHIIGNTWKLSPVVDRERILAKLGESASSTSAPCSWPAGQDVFWPGLGPEAVERQWGENALNGQRVGRRRGAKSQHLLACRVGVVFALPPL